MLPSVTWQELLNRALIASGDAEACAHTFLGCLANNGGEAFAAFTAYVPEERAALVLAAAGDARGGIVGGMVGTACGKLPSVSYQELLNRALVVSGDPERFARTLLESLVENIDGVTAFAPYLPKEPALRLVRDDELAREVG